MDSASDAALDRELALATQTNAFAALEPYEYLSKGTCMNPPTHAWLPRIAASLVFLLVSTLLLSQTSHPTPARAAVGNQIVVNSTSDAAPSDDGFCTLREALLVLNSGVASGTRNGECSAATGDITIDMTSISGTITLSSELPWINRNVRIIGSPDAMPTISGGGKVRVFFINGGDVRMAHLQIANGYARGGKGGDGYGGAGGGGGAAGMGGGVFVRSFHVTFEDVIFRNNTAQGGDGGHAYEAKGLGPGPYGGGGGGGTASDGAAGVTVDGGTGGNGDPIYHEGGENEAGEPGRGIGGDGSDGGEVGDGGGGAAAGDSNNSSGKGGYGGFGGGGGGAGQGLGGFAGSGGFGGGGGGAGVDARGASNANGGGKYGSGGGLGFQGSCCGGGGGGGAGLGGAIFVRLGIVTIIDSQFNDNMVTNGLRGGSDLEKGDAQGSEGDAQGGAIFASSLGLVNIIQTTNASMFNGNIQIARYIFGQTSQNNDVFGKIRYPWSVSISSEGRPSRTGLVAGTFTIKRIGLRGDISKDLQVNFTLSGTALYVTDYTLTIGNTPADPFRVISSVTIPAGQDSITLTITPVTNRIAPPNQSIDLMLNLGEGYIPSVFDSATLVIDKSTPPSWLVLLYVAADDGALPPPGSDKNVIGLTKAANEMLARLRAMPANPNMRLVVLMDTSGGASSVYVRQPAEADFVDMTPQIKGSAFWPNFPSDGRLDAGRTSTLQSYILWARQLYPGSPHTMLSIIDHGGGWAPDFGDASQPRSARTVQSGSWRGLALDYTFGTSLSTRNIGEVFQGLGTLGKFDLIFFDACLMGMLESVYEVQPYADYVIAGENLLWAELSYETYFAPEVLKEQTAPQQLAEQIVGLYNKPRTPERPFTLAALDMRKASDLPARVNILAKELIKVLPQGEKQIRDAYQAAQKFDYDANMSLDPQDGYVDLADFANQLKLQFPQGTSLGIYNASQQVIEGVTQAVIKQEFQNGIVNTDQGSREWNFEDAHGISIYLPLGEQDCRFTGLISLHDVSDPKRRCFSNPEGEPLVRWGIDMFLERQLFYYNAENMIFLRHAPKWKELLEQLEPNTQVREQSRGEFQVPFPRNKPMWKVFAPIIRTSPSRNFQLFDLMDEPSRLLAGQMKVLQRTSWPARRTYVQK